MRAIVCADKNWGIGYKNRLLVSIPSDMKFFRETTTSYRNGSKDTGKFPEWDAA